VDWLPAIGWVAILIGFGWYVVTRQPKDKDLDV
jgi:hypothetical protein